MSTIQNIRKTLGVTQSALASGIAVTQGNISHYERGQTIPPDVALRLINFAKQVGVSLTFDDIYAPELKEADHESINAM